MYIVSALLYILSLLYDMIYWIYWRVSILFRRIHTYLPERKKLWDNQEESIASKMGREKLTKLEEEQKVYTVNVTVVIVMLLCSVLIRD